VRQEAIDHLGEFFGVAGVEGSGDGGRANLLPVAPADPARDHSQHGKQRDGNQPLGFGVFHGIT